ncbi:phosphatidylinositol N-acetylglucosaminyltransferase subunit P-like protein [Kickxella alabastrina]|uniref:phosphatidylinositol N-acetylglucosaminyltransferase subunit P-like protein n=1 Tax=Kickxella alabastrina TaxID=61397 RepID=UPI002220DBEE|nr:phosphatidylinositol N-acetylglucosaminyltransferase subunit P-like protein [Kickxella alabastrina]KAI7830917.1 phosphatidylinositol N-acetylglucosaminyltransferase subunit P-like protein [Kickxella alabastrina]
MVAKTPTFEYYGFVVYLVSLAAFFVYLMWAYLPDNVLEAIGITYYPDRYWALALPAWWMTAVAFVYLFNMAANMYNTPLLNSIDNITDSYSNMPKDMSKAGEFYSSEIGGIPPVSDLPISLVNKCLYQESES